MTKPLPTFLSDFADITVHPDMAPTPTKLNPQERLELIDLLLAPRFEANARDETTWPDGFLPEKLAVLMALELLEQIPNLPNVHYGLNTAALNHATREFDVVPLAVTADKVTGIMAALFIEAQRLMPDAKALLKVRDQLNASEQELDAAYRKIETERQEHVKNLEDFTRTRQMAVDDLQGQIRTLKSVPCLKHWQSGRLAAAADAVVHGPWASLNTNGQMDDFLDDDVVSELDKGCWLQGYMSKAEELKWPPRT